MPLNHAARRQFLWVGLLIAGSAQAQLIGQLQGSAHLSSYAGQTVSGITGIVTAVDGSGFWLQDNGDGNSLSSDAIYVFRSSASKPLVGDAVSVAGRVLEFRPATPPPTSPPPRSVPPPRAPTPVAGRA